ncbi:hypothetical protein PENSPDRAFT_592294 [Peniophora sp. CONT]|nr:hypothetical protein PENSPDRAFT_592294 [Peniophora sp. CONT]
MREQSGIISDLVAHQNWGETTKVDFALYTAGARVVADLTTPSREDPDSDSLGVMEQLWPFNEVSLPDVYPWPEGPAMALHYDTQPGYCWPFAGSHGHLGIMLARRILVEEITIDHVASHLAWDRTPAPRNMELWGLIDLEDDLESASGWENVRLEGVEGVDVPYEDEDPLPGDMMHVLRGNAYMRLARFEYALEDATDSQTFTVDPNVRSLAVPFKTVVLLVYDNWGGTYTCLYRVRVHGSLPGMIFPSRTCIETDIPHRLNRLELP